jgi:hypothetical protein
MAFGRIGNQSCQGSTAWMGGEPLVWLYCSPGLPCCPEGHRTDILPSPWRCRFVCPHLGWGLETCRLMLSPS